MEDVVDFLLGVKGVAAGQIVVEAVFAECFFVERNIAERAEQNGNVAKLERPAGWLFAIGVDHKLRAVVEQLGKAAGDGACLLHTGALGAAETAAEFVFERRFVG